MKKNFKLLMSFILQIILGILFLASFVLKEEITPIFGWLFLSAFVINAIYIGNKTKDDNILFLTIIIVELSLTLLVTLSHPNIVHLGSDELFEAGFSDTIVKTGAINPTLGSGFAKNYYGYTPVLHSLIASASLLTEVSSYVLARGFIFIFLRLLFISIVYIFIKKLLNNDSKLSFLATLAFIPSARLMIMFTTRKLIGAIFLLFAVYSLYGYLKSKNRTYILTLIIFSVLLMNSDRTQSILFFMICLGYAGFLAFISAANKQKIKEILFLGIFLTSYLIMLIIWYLNSVPILMTDLNYIQLFGKYIENLLSGNMPIGSSSGFHMYSLIERILAYSGQLLFLLMAIIGTIYFILLNSKKRNFLSKIIESIFDPELSLFNYLMIIGLSSYAFMLILVLTPWFFMSSVYLWFFSIPLCILTALVVERLEIKFPRFAAFLILLIFVGGLFAKYPPILLDRTNGEGNILELAESRDMLLLDSGEWLSKNSKKGGIVLGDRTVFDIYSGVYGLLVLGGENAYIPQLYSITNETQFENQMMIDSYKYKHAQEVIEGKINYIVLNKDIFVYPSIAFDGDSLNHEEKKVIDSVYYLDNIYDDDNTEIYFNHYSIK